MSFRSIRVVVEDGVVRVALDRPPLNILDIPMLRELRTALREAAGDPSVRVVVLAGAGKAFCAGVDVSDHTVDRIDEMLDEFHGLLLEILDLKVPVVAAVDGAALGGGCELVLVCDVVLASGRAKLGQPEIRLGVFPPVAAALLPRIVGRQRALDLILSGRVVDAEEGLALGLVGRVIPAERFDEEVAAYVRGLASLSRPVLCLTKRAVLEGMSLPVREAVQREEDLYLDELMALKDPHEGLAAFLEKRDPTWCDA